MPEEPVAPEKRRWWRTEPMDEHATKTLMRGLLIAFALYGVGLVLMFAFREVAWASTVSTVLTLTSAVFMIGWWIAVRRGFRIGKLKSRAARRAKMHAQKEREKRMRLNR